MIGPEVNDFATAVEGDDLDVCDKASELHNSTTPILQDNDEVPQGTAVCEVVDADIIMQNVSSISLETAGIEASDIEMVEAGSSVQVEAVDSLASSVSRSAGIADSFMETDFSLGTANTLGHSEVGFWC